ALLARHGFEAVSVKKYNFSGGSLAIAARRAARDVTPPPAPSGVGEKFGQRAREYGARLRPILASARTNGAEIAIYGAGCRACTFNNAHKLAHLRDTSVAEQRA